MARVETDWRLAALGDKRIAMLTYAEKLTLRPGDMTKADVEELVGVGFSARDVLDIAEVVAYYAYVNRIADGLGVSIESWMAPEE